MSYLAVSNFGHALSANDVPLHFDSLSQATAYLHARHPGGRVAANLDAMTVAVTFPGHPSADQTFRLVDAATLTA